MKNIINYKIIQIRDDIFISNYFIRVDNRSDRGWELGWEPTHSMIQILETFPVGFRVGMFENNEPTDKYLE